MQDVLHSVHSGSYTNSQGESPLRQLYLLFSLSQGDGVETGKNASRSCNNDQARAYTEDVIAETQRCLDDISRLLQVAIGNLVNHGHSDMSLAYRYEQAYHLESSKLKQVSEMNVSMGQEIETLRGEVSCYKTRLIPEYDRLLGSQEQEILRYKAHAKELGNRIKELEGIIKWREMTVVEQEARVVNLKARNLVLTVKNTELEVENQNPEPNSKTRGASETETEPINIQKDAINLQDNIVITIPARESSRPPGKRQRYSKEEIYPDSGGQAKGRNRKQLKIDTME